MKHLVIIIQLHLMLCIDCTDQLTNWTYWLFQKQRPTTQALKKMAMTEGKRTTLQLCMINQRRIHYLSLKDLLLTQVMQWHKMGNCLHFLKFSLSLLQILVNVSETQTATSDWGNSTILKRQNQFSCAWLMQKSQTSVSLRHIPIIAVFTDQF